MKYCPSCGNEVNENAIICVKCGTQLSNTTAAGKINSVASSNVSTPGSLSAAFKSAKTGARLILLGSLLSNFFYSINSNGWTIRFIIILYLANFCGLFTLAGYIVSIIACSKAMKSADLSSINDLGIFSEVFKLIKIGIIIMIVATVLSYIGSFFGTGKYLLKVLRFRYQYDYYGNYGSFIFKALVGSLIRIASYVGMAFAMLGCAKGEKVTKGIN